MVGRDAFRTMTGVHAAAIIKVGRHLPRIRALLDTLGLGEQDREKYLEIGESDRMTLRFKKPS